MLPAVIPASVIARFGPFFGRVVAKSPNVLAQVVNALRRAGASIEPTVSAVVNYVKANPMNAATVFTILASLGVAVADLFENSDKADPNARSAAAVLDATAAKARGADIPSAVLRAAANSESLDVQTSNVEDTQALREVCSWAQSFFGSPSRAMEAHAMMQGFFELPRAKAQYAFDHLRLGR